MKPTRECEVPVTRESFMHCLTCDYDLRGLDKNRCPECGREFDPGNPETFKSVQDCPHRPLGSGIVSITFVVVMVTAGFFLLVEKGRESNPWLLATWVFGSGLLSTFIGTRSKDMLISVAILAVFTMMLLGPSCPEPPDWPIPLAIIAALAVLLFGGFLAGRLIRRLARPD